MFSRQLLCTLVVLLAFAISVVAAPEEPKRDRFGDPLPEGAIARLGNLLLRNEEPIFAAAFTADGKRLIVGDAKSISLWDPATGKAIRRTALKNAVQIRLRRLSADGSTLIQGGFDNILRFIDTATGAEQRTLNHAQCGFIQALDVSRDGKILVAVHQASIALWDVPNSKLLHEFKGPPITPLTTHSHLATVTADGKHLILPHTDGSLHLIDVASGKELRAFEMPPMPPGRHPSQRLQKLALSPDGRYLAFGGPATPLTVCQLSTGKRLHELAPEQGILSGLTFTPNGRFLAVDEYNRIRLFGVLSGKEIRTLPLRGGIRNGLLFSPDGRTLAALDGSLLHLWDMTDGRQLHPIVGHDAALQALVFFPDGKRLVAADYSGGIKVWDVASSRILAQRTNMTTCVSLAVDEDGENVRFSGFDISAHRWNPRTGQEESRNRVVAGLSTNQLALSPDGRSMAVLTINGGGRQKQPAIRQLRLYDLTSNKSMVLPGLAEQSWVSQLVFTPDSRRFAAVSNDGFLRLWDRDSGKLLREFKREGPGRPPNHLVFAADGRSFAMLDGAFRIREMASGVDRLQIPLTATPWIALAYSPDGRFLAHGQQDGQILVYSAATGKQLAHYQANHGGVRALAFSRDGRLLASGGENGTILIWNVPKDASLRANLKADEAVSFWQALGDSDAGIANRALAGLAAAPAQTLPLFKERLRPLGKPLDEKRLARLIAELDDDSFTVRERATRELGIIGPDAADDLRQALHNDPSAESKRRIEGLLSRLKAGGDPQRLRFLRSIEVLERIGTPQAKEQLRDLSAKPLPAELREDIEASLRRMEKRRPTP